MFGDAEAYERFMGRWSRLVAPPLVEFTSIRDGARVLDVGSGTGALAFAIAAARKRCHVMGIDPSSEYVAYASSRNRDPKRVSFEVGDAQALKFHGGSFDDSASLLVFNFIPDPKKALGEVRRVTKPGGNISAAVWDYGAGMRMLRTFWDAAVTVDPKAEKLDEKHMRLCRAGELAALWREGGLLQVVEQPIDVAMQFTSFADYWEPFLLGQGPAGAYLRSLPAVQVADIRAAVRRILPISRDDAPFTLPARVWAVRGTVGKV
jgi:SAM-dependent methyltransferase